ncbi:progonadoliberin-1-like [Rhinoraja longicauda]
MLSPRRVLIYLVVGAMLVHLASPQHWSYDLRPGGKRDTSNAMDSMHGATDNVDRKMQSQRTELLDPDRPANTAAKFVPGWETAHVKCHQGEEYESSPVRADCQRLPAAHNPPSPRL